MGVYAYIIHGTSCGNEKIDNLLSDLRRINVSTAYSFLLMLLKSWERGNFQDAEIVDLLDAFRIYVFRRRILGLTAAENKNFPALVDKLDILKESEDKRNKMFEILSSQENNLRLPNDIEMFRALETMNFYNFKYCKFILALIEEHLTRARPNLSDPKLQIEHIMPQKLNDAWKEVLGENWDTDHQALVNSIGNLTLIRHNQELGQKSFSEKKEVYENNAGLQIARTEITNNDIWNQDAIQRRTKWIAEYLLENVLIIPDRRRKINNFIPKEGRHLSFQELQLIGQEINFIPDPVITAKIVSDKEVDFEGKMWKLAPLTRELMERRGQCNQSRSYSGARYWSYDGIRLDDII